MSREASLVPPFVFDAPATIRFGAGTVARLAELVAPLGTRVAVLHGPHWFAASAWASQLTRTLAPLRPQLVAVAAGEPTPESVAAVIERCRSAEVDCLVGIGGGSVLDTTKAVAGMILGDRPVGDYVEAVTGDGSVTDPAPLPERALPWLAVPTTGGTGAEVTQNAVLRIVARGIKRSVRSPRLLARAVVVDPELAVGLDPRVTATTGLDALCQLVEAYVSTKQTALARSIAAGGIAPLVTGLRRLAAAPGDVDARAGAAYGALASGLALANSGLGAAHGFASGLGGLYDIPHGHICAAFLGPVCRANASAIAADLGELLQRAGVSAGGDPVDWVAATVTELAGAFGLATGLAEYGVPAGAVGRIVERSQGSSMAGNPVSLSAETQQQLVRDVLEVAA